MSARSPALVEAILSRLRFELEKIRSARCQPERALSRSYSCSRPRIPVLELCCDSIAHRVADDRPYQVRILAPRELQQVRFARGRRNPYAVRKHVRVEQLRIRESADPAQLLISQSERLYSGSKFFRLTGIEST